MAMLPPPLHNLPLLLAASKGVRASLQPLRLLLQKRHSAAAESSRRALELCWRASTVLPAAAAAAAIAAASSLCRAHSCLFTCKASQQTDRRRRGTR
jgi:hypothetical protein